MRGPPYRCHTLDMKWLKLQSSLRWTMYLMNTRLFPCNKLFLCDQVG